uniref:Putative secreted protein n=1 Tax=Anopheles darlingi TaxID=43151 RepID=A0A2M4D7U3_ANODA
MMMMLVMMMIAVDDGDSRRLMVALATTHRSRQWRRWWCGQITTSDSTTSGSTGSVLSVSAKFVRIQPTDRRVATVSQCGCYELWGHSACSMVGVGVGVCVCVCTRRKSIRMKKNRLDGSEQQRNK